MHIYKHVINEPNFAPKSRRQTSNKNARVIRQIFHIKYTKKTIVYYVGRRCAHSSANAKSTPRHTAQSTSARVLPATKKP